MNDSGLPRLPDLELWNERLDLNRFLGNSYEDIGQAAIELPSIIEWVNIQMQKMVELKITSKQRVNRIRAAAFVRLKNGAWKDHVPEARPTDTVISELVELDDEVTQAVEDLATYTGWGYRLTNLIFVLQAKLDLVRSTETTRRAFIPRQPDDE